jgi:hypothetical protein
VNELHKFESLVVILFAAIFCERIRSEICQAAMEYHPELPVEIFLSSLVPSMSVMKLS